MCPPTPSIAFLVSSDTRSRQLSRSDYNRAFRTIPIHITKWRHPSHILLCFIKVHTGSYLYIVGAFFEYCFRGNSVDTLIGLLCGQAAAQLPPTCSLYSDILGQCVDQVAASLQCGDIQTGQEIVSFFVNSPRQVDTWVDTGTINTGYTFCICYSATSTSRRWRPVPCWPLPWLPGPSSAPPGTRRSPPPP